MLIFLLLLVFVCYSTSHCNELQTANRTTDDTLSKWVTDPVIAPKVEYHIFFSQSVGENVSYHIYLPEAYHTESDRRFPVVYWLHGGALTADVTSGIPFLSSWFDNLIDEGTAPAMIIVFPNGLPFGMWCDSKDGTQPVESMLVHDLIPHIDEAFRTIDSREGRMLEGWSMGGYGAARLGLKHNDMFGGFSMLGAGPLQLDFLEDGPRVPLPRRLEIFEAVYGSDTTYFLEQSPWHIAESIADQLPPDMPIRQAVGEMDELLENNRIFHQHITDLGIEHEYYEIPEVGHEPQFVLQYLGTHDPDFYNTVFAYAVTVDPNSTHPTGLRLNQNFPNPFNPSTIIRFELAELSYVRLEVYDIAGRKVRLLLDTELSAGYHKVVFNASGLATGFYSYRLVAGSKSLQHKMLYLR